MLEQQRMDYLITGEGKIDSQTLQGKLISGVMGLGKTFHVPVIAVCGMLDVEKKLLLGEGLKEVLEVRDKSKPLVYNMEHAALLIENAVSDYFRTL